MLFGRVLAGSAQQNIADRDARVAKIVPRQPFYAPPVHERDQKRRRREQGEAAINAALAAEFLPARQPTMGIFVSDDAADHLAHQHTQQEIDSAQAGLGMFFGTGIWLDEAQVWKSIPSIENPPPMYIFKLDSQWFCAGSIWLDQADMHRDEAQRSIIISWSSNFKEDNPDYPSHPIHMPYWDQKPKIEVRIVLGFDMIMDYESEVNNLVQQLSDRNGSSDNDVAPPHAASSIGPKAHEPWLFKCASLIKTYRNRQWCELERIHDEYMGLSSKLREIVNKGKLRPWTRR